MATKKTTTILVVKDKNYKITSPKQMVEMANVLKGYVVKQRLYTNIFGKNYVHVEGWQFAGGLMGLFPKVTNVEDVSKNGEYKWKAEVEIVSAKTNQVVSTGFALCSNKENKKKSFDEYAVLSMAQTRAIGKAYRNIVGWVMKLAGYEGTPTEEMVKVGDRINEPVVQSPTPAVKTAKKTYKCSETGNVITEAEYNYSKKIYGVPLSREVQKNFKPKK